MKAQVGKSKEQAMYNREWKANNQRQYNLALSKTADADIIAILDAQTNKVGFIREAIRAYLTEYPFREEITTLERDKGGWFL